MGELQSSFISALYKPPSLLPIARHKASLLYTIEKYPICIVVGQTGSGKTTQLPQFLDQAGWCADGKVIGVTQVSNARPPRLIYTRIFDPCSRAGSLSSL